MLQPCATTECGRCLSGLVGALLGEHKDGFWLLVRRGHCVLQVLSLRKAEQQEKFLMRNEERVHLLVQDKESLIKQSLPKAVPSFCCKISVFSCNSLSTKCTYKAG